MSFSEKMKSDGCESCAIPLYTDPGESSKYCSWCYRNGAFTYQGGDIKEFKRLLYAHLRERKMNAIVARVFTLLVNFTPRWQKKK